MSQQSTHSVLVDYDSGFSLTQASSSIEQEDHAKQAAIERFLAKKARKRALEQRLYKTIIALARAHLQLRSVDDAQKGSILSRISFLEAERAALVGGISMI